MIFLGELKKTIWFSLLGHLSVFMIFSFSFGYKIPKLSYPEISFCGRILRPADLKAYPASDAARLRNTPNPRSIQEVISKKTEVKLINDSEEKPAWFYDSYIKPVAFMPAIPNNKIFMTGEAPLLYHRRKDVPAVMFYPSLPQHFLIYFKDRQLAHIELTFNIVSGKKINPIIIKRKISSGNLEADLLSMRYISHYLFVQQAAFPSNVWQNVKIELSAKGP